MAAIFELARSIATAAIVMKRLWRKRPLCSIAMDTRINLRK
jgi:hypothetical protein